MYFICMFMLIAQAVPEGDINLITELGNFDEKSIFKSLQSIEICQYVQGCKSSAPTQNTICYTHIFGLQDFNDSITIFKISIWTKGMGITIDHW